MRSKSGGTTMVVVGSSTMAGPKTMLPFFNRRPSYTGVLTRFPSKKTSRLFFSALEASGPWPGAG